jgi:uncharacterized protein (TIGR04255 family)
LTAVKLPALVEIRCNFARFAIEEAMSDAADHDLPDFDNPPLVETVLSAQFNGLAAMRSVHFGLFWQRLRDEFPNTEEHAPLLPFIEQPSDGPAQAIQLRFDPQETLPLPRLWLLNKSGSEIMQIQNDRFIKNWRKGPESAEYPHYTPVLKPAFERHFSEFMAFAEEQRLGPIKVTQCEVTYVSHIVAGEGWDRPDEIEKIFTFWKQPSTDGAYPGKAEDFGCRIRFPIFGPENEWIGRLHVEMQPALHIAANKPMYALNLTARGMYGTGIEFFDIGRRRIVKSFERLTTEHMHAYWRKKKR